MIKYDWEDEEEDDPVIGDQWRDAEEAEPDPDVDEIELDETGQLPEYDSRP